ncbi:MAG: rod shape-determining protein MreD [Chloroflexi bacterium]|nr:rod shape-determining protein MreD [Chloroflexota bacterium]
MNLYLSLASLLGLVLLQTAVATRITLWGVHPDILLMVVVSWSLLRGVGEGVTWAFVSGVLLDLLSSGSFGIITIALVSAAYLTGVGEGNLFREAFLLPFIACLIASVVYYFVIFSLSLVFGHANLARSGTFNVIAIGTLFNVVLMPLVYLPLRAISRRMRPSAPRLD